MNINGSSAKFQPGNQVGRRWQRGQSGNPAGKSKGQREFEQALANALAGADATERVKRASELAELVWSAARKGEAWAIMLLFQRLAPEPLKLKVEVTRGADEIDFGRLTDEQIGQLESILDQVGGPATCRESGEGSEKPA